MRTPALIAIGLLDLIALEATRARDRLKHLARHHGWA